MTTKRACSFIGMYAIAAMLSVEAFMPMPNFKRSATTCQTVNMVDPALVAAAAGIVGTAAGWGSRSGEVADLQRQNVEKSEQLASAQKEYEQKKENYERALYEMDSEFEGQTEKIKKEFEQKLEKTKVVLEADYKTKLKKVKSKIEEDAKLRMVEREGKLKQEFLQDKMAYEAHFNARSAEDIVHALDKQSKLVSENKELKESLDQVQADLKEIMKMKNRLM